MQTLFGCLSSRLLIVSFSALILMLSTNLVASANPAAPGVTGGAGSQSLPAYGAIDPLRLNVQYWACADCRNFCYATWRVRCGYSPYCRRNFVVCMRRCWYRICRY